MTQPDRRRMAEALAIVYALASEPPWLAGICVHCGVTPSQQHHPDCLYRRARQWADEEEPR